MAMYQAAEGDPNASVVQPLVQPSLLAKSLVSFVLSSYDDPVLWKGHPSMVKEMKSQLHYPPDAIFCSVGGGGLIGGIFLGCQSVAWDNGSSASQSINGHTRTRFDSQFLSSP